MGKSLPLTEIFKQVKERITKNELTLKEITQNTGVSEELLDIFFDDNNDVVRGLSNIIGFMKFNLYYREIKFQVYHIRETITQFRITRTIEPKCFVYFDKADNKFYSFQRIPRQPDPIHETQKQIILSDIKAIIDNINSKRDEDKNYQ